MGICSSLLVVLRRLGGWLSRAGRVVRLVALPRDQLIPLLTRILPWTPEKEQPLYRRHVVQGERCYVLLLPYILPPPTCRCRVSSEMTMDLFDLGSVVVIDLMPMLWRVRVGVTSGSINVSECIKSRLFELFNILRWTRSLIRSSFSYQWLTCKGISSVQRLSKVSR